MPQMMGGAMSYLGSAGSAIGSAAGSAGSAIGSGASYVGSGLSSMGSSMGSGLSSLSGMMSGGGGGGGLGSMMGGSSGPWGGMGGQIGQMLGGGSGNPTLNKISGQLPGGYGALLHGVSSLVGGGGGSDEPDIRAHGAPNSPLLGALFGTRLTPQGWDQSKKRGGLFGMGAKDLLEQSRDFMFNAEGPSGAERGLYDSFLGGGGSGMGQAGALFGNLNSGFGDLVNRATNLADTGYRTDASPIYAEAMRRFKSESLPGIAELVGSKIGLNSQSFIDAASKEGANLMGQAALRQSELDESAAQRRMGALPTLGQFNLQRAAAPMSFLNDMMNLGTGYRNMLEAPKTRGMSMASSLLGMPMPQMLQSSYNPAGSGGASGLASLASTLPGILQGMSGMFGGGGGGGGGSTVNSGNLSNALFSQGPLYNG